MNGPHSGRPNPFVGPRAIRSEEHLFGRDLETVELAYLLIPERIVLFYSPSGAGKTSLIQAALIDRLQDQGFGVVEKLLRVNLEPPPWAKEVEGFNRYTFSLLSGLEETVAEESRQGVEELARTSLAGYLEDRGLSRMVLLFDQFEEILTLDPTGVAVKEAFFRDLGAALQNRSYWALFAMREDFAAGLDNFRHLLPTQLRNTFRLDFLDKKAAREVMQKTALQEDVKFEDEAVDLLIEDLSQVKVMRPDGKVDERQGEYVEPLQLQVVGRRLWKGLRPGASAITPADVSRIGDVDQSLAEYYAGELEAIAGSDLQRERRMRVWMEQALIAEGGIRKQVLMSPEASDGLENEAIEALVDRHLVRRERSRGAIWFELAHDRLIQPVRANNAAWFDTHLNRLQKQAALWNREGRGDSRLLAGVELAEAQAWAGDHPQALLEYERDFLAESVQRAEEIWARIENEKKVAVAEGVAEEQRKRRVAVERQNRIIVVVGALAVLFALAAMYFAWQNSLNARDANTASVTAIAGQKTAEAASAEIAAEKEAAEAAQAAEAAARAEAEAAQALAEAASAEIAAEKEAAEAARADEAAARAEAEAAREVAEEQRLVAQSRGLAAQAQTYLNQDLPLALLLSIEAYSHTDTVEARGALLAALQRRLARTVVPAAPLLPLPAYGDITAIAVHPDNETIAIGTQTGQVLLWNPGDQGGARFFAEHGTQVLSLAFSPDGDILASGGLLDSLNLWQVPSGIPLADDLEGNGQVLSLDFSPGGDRLASAGIRRDRRVVIWDVSDPGDPQEIRVLRGPREPIRAVAWSPKEEDNLLAGVSSGGLDSRVWVWNADNENSIGQTDHNSTAPYWSVAWSPDGQSLASGDAAGNVYLWDVATMQRQGDPLFINPTEMLGLAFSPDGKTLLAVNGSGVLSFWDVELQELLQDVITSQARSATFNAGRTWLALGSGADNVTVWDITLEQPLRQELAALDGAVQSLVFLDADTWLAATAADRGPAIWEGGGQEPERRIFVRQEALSLALSPDGTLLALGREDGLIRILDGSSGEQAGQIEEFETPILSLAFQPGSDLFAFGDEGGIVELWYLDENRAASPFSLPTQYEGASGLAFSQDRAFLVSGFRNGGLNLWELQGESIQGSLPWFGQRAGIASLAFHPDGSILASGSPDQTIRLWNVENRQAIGDPLSGAGSAVTALAYDPSGSILLTGEEGGIVARWDMDPRSWVERACALAGRNLKKAEWQVFLPDEPHRQTCPQWPPEN